MPIQRSNLFRDKGDLMGPGTAQDDGYGNAVQGPATDVLIKAAVRIGLFPKTDRHDWIMPIAGAPTNTRDWSVAVPGSVSVEIGMAFVVAAGPNPGTYRIKQVTKGVSRSSPTLCVANKEK